MTDDLDALLTDVNTARRADDPDACAEGQLEHRCRCSHRLAVYGTLRPGAANHGVVAELIGEWHDGIVHGTLQPSGSDTALRWHEDGGEVAVKLLVSPALPAHWARLDAFEGDGYRRILVPVRRAGGRLDVANLYEAR